MHQKYHALFCGGKQITTFLSYIKIQNMAFYRTIVLYSKGLCFRLLLGDYVNWGVVFCCPVVVDEDKDTSDICVDSEAAKEQQNHSRSSEPLDSPWPSWYPQLLCRVRTPTTMTPQSRQKVQFHSDPSFSPYRSSCTVVLPRRVNQHLSIPWAGLQAAQVSRCLHLLWWRMLGHVSVFRENWVREEF